MFASLPIGSAVVVQHKDRGLWTHGTIVGTGDHNHHDCAYTIQLTTNDRQIMHNRQHIKPTAVTADTYIQHNVTKQSHTRMDPLADILNNINKNLVACTSAYNNNNINSSAQCIQQTNNTHKGKAMDNKEQNSIVASNGHRQGVINVPKDKGISLQDREVIKTRYGQIVKKNPDRLLYI